MPWPFDDEEEDQPEQPVADRGYVPGEIGARAADAVAARYRAMQPPERGLLGKAVDVAGQGLEGLMYGISLPKRGVDALARGSARAMGVPVPDEMTTEQMLQQAVIPDQGPTWLTPLGIGESIATAAARKFGVPEETIQRAEAQAPDLALPEGSYRRAAVRAGVGLAGALATDPLTYVGVPGVGASRGGRVASKILTMKDPATGRLLGEEAALYAPELVQGARRAAVAAPSLGLTEKAALEAGKGLLSATEKSAVRRAVEKGTHLGFQAMMAHGAYAGGKEALRQYAEAGEVTPGVVEAGVGGALSAAMVGAPFVGKLAGRAREAQIGRAATIKPTAPRPIDRLPEALISEAEPIASQFARQIVSDPNVVDTSVLEAMLPETLRPHLKTIHEQAVQEAASIKEGQTWLAGLRERYGDDGEPGVETIPRDDTGENFLLVQRDERGRIVGGAQVDGNVRTFVAGGRAMDSPVSASPLLARLDELGVQGAEPEMLSVMGAKARRTAVEPEARPIEPAYVTPESPDIRYATEQPQRRGVGPGFYSRLREVVDDPKTQGTQRGADWLRFLQDPKRAVKADELKWTGLDDWLKGKGGERVTKQEVQEFLDQNEVRVEEVVHPKAPQYGEDGPGAEGHIPGTATKFSQWQEPGGSNYRELLLTLPRSKDVVSRRIGSGFTKQTYDLSRLTSEERQRFSALSGVAEDGNLTPREEPEWYALTSKAAVTRSPEFTGGHFDEPNVLAHVRFNDRVDADGKRVLFVEEFQSDWGEKGREHGFGRKIGVLGTGGMLPHGPFVTDTSKWTELAVKRVLKYAADNGYDRVAWTPGEVQVNRYDLSKQVDSVAIARTPEGFREGKLRVSAYKNGDEVVEKFVNTFDEVADVVGKDLADKAQAELATKDTALFEGQELKVGGKGMRAFYDEMVPQAFNKIAKKWGAKAGEIELPGAASDKRALDTILREDFNSSWGSATPELREQAKAIKDGRGVDINVHSIDITPEMKAEVSAKGFPLFAAKEGPGIPLAEPEAVRKLLVDLYPNGSHIKEADGAWTITLPDKRRVTWRTGEKEIEIDLNAFERAYGRKPVEGEKALGVTYRLPNEAIVNLVEGATDRVALHEQWHIVKHLGSLDQKSLNRLRKVYGSEEAEADAFAKWLQSERRRPNGIFERIWAAIQKLYQHITGRPETAFRAGMESLGQRAPVAEGPAYGTLQQATGGIEPFPQVPEGEPLGQPKAKGLPPRVEMNVVDLEAGIAEQKALGIDAPELILSRDTRRTWKSLDPDIKKRIQTWDDDAVIKQVEQGKQLGDVDVMALDAVVRGRYEAKESAREAYIKAKGTADEPVAWARYIKENASLLPLAMARIQDGTSTARALAARGRLMEAAQTKDLRFLRRIMREFPGVSARDAENLVQMFETGDPRLATALQALMVGKSSRFWTAYRANLLGIPSEVGNFVGNMVTQGVSQLDKLAELGLDKAFGLKTGQRMKHASSLRAGRAAAAVATPGALRDYLRERVGFIETTAEGKKQLGGMYGRAWRGESRPIDPNLPIEYQVSPFKSKAGRIIFGTRLESMGSGDMLFRTPIMAEELAIRANELAIKRTGKTDGPVLAAETGRILQEVREQPEKHPDMLRSAQDATLRRVYQDKPGKALSAVLQLRRSVPLMNAVFPFVQTPAKITSYAIKHSPLGFLTPDILKAIKGGMSQEELAEFLAPRLVGTTIFGALATAAAAGLMTGGGPTDPKQQKALRATGWQPYSLVIPTDEGNVYLPFTRFEPVAQIAGIAADLAEMKDQKSMEDVISKSIGTITANLADRTYMRGLMDFSDALSSPRQYMGAYLSGFGRALVPRDIVNLAKAVDPIMRDTRPLDRGFSGWPERIAKEVAAEIPGVSKLLPEQKTPTGEPRERPGSAFTRAFLPVQVTTTKPGTELEALMAQVQYVPGQARNYTTINGRPVALARGDIAQMQKADLAASQELRSLIRSSRFRMLPDTMDEGGNNSKEYVLRSTFRKHRAAAREALLASRDFRRRAAQQLARPSA